MKAIRIMVVTLLFLFFNVFSLCMITDIEYESEKGSPIAGYWQSIFPDSKIILQIVEEPTNTYSGMLVTFKNDAAVSNMKLGEISYNNLDVSIVTNSEKGIVFKGILDTVKQEIIGYLSFRNGNKMDFELKKYNGKECEYINQLVISEKLVNYKTIEQLPTVSGDYNLDLKLNTSLLSEVQNESKLEESDIINSILRWQGEIFPDYEIRSKALLNAFLLDPVTEQISKKWQAILDSSSNKNELIERINKWTTSNLAYTQGDKQFLSYPGNDPWGVQDDGATPTFKKLIPSEMRAMQLYTNKISGKCFTLVNLIASNFIQMGVDPDNILILITKKGNSRHAMGLIKIDDNTLLVNLMFVDFIAKYLNNNFSTYEVIGIYNNKFARKVDLKIGKSDIEKIIFAKDKQLVHSFIEHFNLDVDFTDYGTVESIPFINREAFYSSIFLNQKRLPSFDLSKYAYQSLYVKYPAMYLKASLRSSAAKNLAKINKYPNDVFNWIKQHIRVGSIFPDYNERIMTSDQVLVFQQGGYKDKAVLAYTLLKLNGFKPIIFLTENNAFIKIDDQYYNFRDDELSKSFNHDFVLTIE